MSTNLDLVNEITVEEAAHFSVSADGTLSGDAVDTATYLSGMAVVSCSQLNDGEGHSNALTLQHSDDGITFVDIPTANLLGSNLTVDAVTDTATPLGKQGFFGQKRYVTASCVSTSVDGEGDPTIIDVDIVLKTSTTTAP